MLPLLKVCYRIYYMWVMCVMCRLYAAINLVLGQPLPLSCPSHSLVVLWQLLMMVMRILVMVLLMNIFLPVDSQLSKCCGEEEIFYQDTMECGPDKVGYGVWHLGYNIRYITSLIGYNHPPPMQPCSSGFFTLWEPWISPPEIWLLHILSIKLQPNKLYNENALL